MGAVHTRPVERTYERGLGCGSCLLQLVGIFVSFVIPFIVVYTTGNLWVREFSFTEQPSVTFLNKALVAVRGSGPGVRPLVWSSLHHAEALLGDLFEVPFFEHYSEDLDTDGRTDRMHFDVRFMLPDGFHAVSAEAVMLVQWDMDSVIPISMESALYSSVASPEPMASARVEGDLGWSQRGPLLNNRWVRYDEIYNDSLYTEWTIGSAADLEVAEVLRRYAARNESTPFAARATATAAEPPRLPRAVPGDPAPARELALHLRVDIPPVTIAHHPETAQVLKFGVVQYFVFAFIFSRLWGVINGAVVECGCVNTVSRCPELDALKGRQPRPRY